MRRKGISLSMNLVVISLILLVVATAVVFAFTGQWNIFRGITSSQINSSQKELAANRCIQQKQDLCQYDQYESGDKKWWEHASYGGRDCSYWIVQQQVLPTQDGKPFTCGEEYQ
ncbi:MAG: hypothetical protein SV186_01255 [Candidatus Nanohaloarchaea archaeon]|nr:hypothetical protein [Candidatus Nanohaloarchaea archaeon]